MPSGPLRRVVFAAVCVVAIAALLWCWPWSTTDPVPALGPATTAAATTTVDPANVPLDTAQRSEAAAPNASPDAVFTVVGRCLAAEDDTPLAAALHVGGDDGTADGDAGALPAQALASATAGANGRFLCAVPLAAAIDLRLHLAAPERAPVGALRAAAAPGSTWDVGDVRLVRCARVRGEVLDATGAQVNDAQVRLVMIGHERPALGFREMHTTFTDARGAFTFAAPIAAGEWYVGVECTGALRTPRKTQVPAGGEHVVSIEVERPDPAFAIRGKVVDRSGAPLLGIELAAYGDGARGRAVSGADGTFVLHKGPPHFDRGQTGIELSAQRLGLEQASPTKGVVAAWGQRDVVVVMRPLAEVLVRARDARGGVVWPFRVVAGRLTADGAAWLPLRQAQQQQGPDHVVLTRVASGAHTLLLLPQDAALGLAGPVPFTVDESTPRELEVRVPEAMLVQIDVVDATGVPVPRCTLELIASLTANAPDASGPAPDLTTARTTNSNGRPPRQFALASATTGADGRVTFAAPPGSWLVRARCTTHLPTAVTINIAAGAAHHRLVLVAAAVLHGRLVPAEVLPALGLHEAKPERRLAVVARASKDVVARAGVDEVARAVVAADGTFELGPLPPGVALLRLATWLAANDVQNGVVQHVLGDVDGTGGGHSEREFDVGSFAPATATGIVVFDGAPLRHGQFFLRRLLPEPVQTVRVPTDGDGRFRTRVPPGELGPQLAIPSDPGPGHVILPMAERWSVAAGRTIELRLEAVTRRLRLRVLAPGGTPLANTRVLLSSDGYERPGALQTDGQGRVDVVPAPYGTFRMRAKDGSGRDLASAPCTIAAGAEADVVEVLLEPRAR